MAEYRAVNLHDIKAKYRGVFFLFLISYGGTRISKMKISDWLQAYHDQQGPEVSEDRSRPRILL